jgi:hypothetical protein
MTRDRDDSDDEQSEFSDIDYQGVHVPRSMNTISSGKFKELWTKQSGCCYITHMPIDINCTGLYGVSIAPRRISEPVGDENCVLVIEAVKAMQESVGLTWTQLKALFVMCAQD